MIHHIDSLVEGKIRNVPYTKLIIISSVLGVVGVVSQLITYFLGNASVSESDRALWLARMLADTAKDCNAGAATKYIFNEKSIIIGGMSLLAYGAYLGVLVQTKFFPYHSWPYMFDTNALKAGLRILIILVLALPAGVAFLAVSSNSSLVILIIFKTNFSLFGICLSIFSLSNMIFVKAKLVNDNYSTSKPILPE